MEKAEPSMGALPSFKASGLWRGGALHPGKNWYVVTKDICRMRLMDFCKSKVFRRFPGELQRIPAWELQPAKSDFAVNFARMPRLRGVLLFFACR